MKRHALALPRSLSRAFIAPLENPGPEPHIDSGEAYEALVDGLPKQLATDDTWLFAYGSLIWEPEIDHVEARRGTTRGWHCSFCYRITRFLGTKEQPGLMMSLDRGGQCRIAQRPLEKWGACE